MIAVETGYLAEDMKGKVLTRKAKRFIGGSLIGRILTPLSETSCH